MPNIMPFSYSTSLGSSKLLELDEFNRITLSLHTVTRPASKDEYKDYNSQESYDPSKEGALALEHPNYYDLIMIIIIITCDYDYKYTEFM